jgi:hypothetical protein
MDFRSARLLGLFHEDDDSAPVHRDREQRRLHELRTPGLQYGVFGQLYPILVLHAGLLPLKVIRLRQVRRLVDAVGAASDDEAIRALIPYMKTEEHSNSSSGNSDRNP